MKIERSCSKLICFTVNVFTSFYFYSISTEQTTEALLEWDFESYSLPSLPCPKVSKIKSKGKHLNNRFGGQFFEIQSKQWCKFGQEA